MNKKAKYAIYAGAATGTMNSFHPIDWSRILKATLKDTASGGAGGFLVGAYVGLHVR
jgi:hypothetical protein